MADAPQCGCSFSLTSFQVWKAGSVIALIVTDMGLSLGMSKLFHDTPFKFPLYLTMMTMFLSFCLAGLVLNTDVEGRTLPKLKKLQLSWPNILKICAQALAFALNASLFNLSLEYTSLTMSMIVRASIPLFAVIFTTIMRRRFSSLAVWIAVIGNVVGMAMTIYKNPQFELLGFLFSVGSALTAALFMVLSEYIMLSVELDALNMLFYAALPTTIFIFPFFIALEFVAVVSYIQSYFWMHIFIVCAFGILAFSFSVSQYQVVRVADSVYATVVENIQVVLTVILSAVIFYDSEKRLSLINQGGVVLTLICFTYITFLDFSEHRQHKIPGSDFVKRFLRKVRGVNTYEVCDGHDGICLQEEQRRFSIINKDEYIEDDEIIEIM